ncbi:hypothetical protein ACFXPJ_29090, partial [Streptomyces goshikiensis]
MRLPAPSFRPQPHQPRHQPPNPTTIDTPGTGPPRHGLSPEDPGSPGGPGGPGGPGPARRRLSPGGHAVVPAPGTRLDRPTVRRELPGTGPARPGLSPGGPGGHSVVPAPGTRLARPT